MATVTITIMNEVDSWREGVWPPVEWFLQAQMFVSDSLLFFHTQKEEKGSLF